MKTAEMNTKSPKMVAAGRKAAATRKKRAIVRRAQRTAKWATTMTKWLVTKSNYGVRWQLVAFTGPSGRESRGVVDILAIRKNHSTAPDGLKRGDLFEMVLLQIKGGGARWPTWGDVERLRKVARHHKAKSVVLAELKPGRQPTFFRLNRSRPMDRDAKSAWTPVSPHAMFG